MKYYKFNFNMLLLNVLSFVLFVICFIPVVLFFKNIEIDINVLIYTFLWMILHELIHGLGFFINKGVKAKNITFGALFEKGIFYCMCKQKINKKAILIALVSPLVLIGFITLGISFIIHDSILAFLSVMNIAGAIGDIVMFIMIIRMPKEVFYTDLDEPDSFILISNHDLNKFIIPGVVIKEVGDYNESMRATDFRKLVISKSSLIVIVILLIVFLLKVLGAIL